MTAAPRPLYALRDPDLSTRKEPNVKVYRAELRGYVFVAFDDEATEDEVARTAAAKVEAGELAPAWRVVAVDDQGTDADLNDDGPALVAEEEAIRAVEAASAARTRDCAYCEGVQATHRVRWTVYGGGLKSVRVCDRHAAVARGQRGVEVERLCPHGRPCPEGRLCACSNITVKS